MECDRCGARRPLSGPCPNCGAPPPGRSSGADWRNRSGQGSAMPPRGRGASGPDWGGRGGSGANWGYDDEMQGPPPGRYGRSAQGYPDYEEVDLERALVPTGGMLPGTYPAGVPGLPGMPSEQEERLLGIRRPVYIPATTTKRRRVASWRVISGILTIVLACVAACGVGGVFGKKYLDGIHRFVPSIGGVVPPPVLTGVPATPVSTPGPAAKYVVSVTTAQRVDASYHPIGITSKFLVGDTVYVVAEIRNAPSGQHKICVHWFVNGQDPHLPPTAQLCRSTDGQPNLTAYFSLPYNQPGEGTARVYWDPPASETYAYPATIDPAVAQTIFFGVYEPAAPTSVPRTPTPTPKGTTTTPSPTKTP